jgi:hypothetical protein
MEKAQQHGCTPPDLKAPVYRHSSETARSQNDAGGPLPASEWSPRPVGGNDEKR